MFLLSSRILGAPTGRGRMRKFRQIKSFVNKG
ncbi:hypothetical protein CPT_Magnus_038 [Klebsiella phage Magnus]|uniref:Uncharacterized protein n=1 Tax=Klebsiella phage Magnus TaxID=2589660 RepID=A0A5B9N1B6_9CAUD|nr:hypothetical protein HYP92_gp203 [Klebsiella phage Magnus]QEG07917.1 hypothetical protein CPT_Magnus_038 [Klebsiella phage Magnus]